MKTTGFGISLRAFVLLLFVSALGAHAALAAASLRFYGNGSGDIDRVKIPIDDPSDSNPARQRTSAPPISRSSSG
jgi:hypothetical protein